MRHMIDAKYLPFSREELQPHFTGDQEQAVKYFEDSAKRCQQFLQEYSNVTGMPLEKAKHARQLEKDERFWTVTCLKTLHEHPDRSDLLHAILSATFGDKPPLDDLGTWEECLDGQIELFFEAQIPSPRGYVEWLKENVRDRQMIPYILDAAERKSARVLEGPTHVDAVFINQANGFALLIEAKVLSDIAYSVSFDNYRNQLARYIDIMLEPYPSVRCISERKPQRSLFALLTPDAFRKHPTSRLYGWLLQEYKSQPQALARDLPHRGSLEWSTVSRRLGWITFEDVNMLCPGTCPWFANQSI